MKRLLTLGICLALATGCASVRSILPGSDSTVGDQMISQAQETKELGKNFNDGQRLVDRGQKLMSKSEQLARESRQIKAEAEGLIVQGETLMDGSKSSYETAFGDAEQMAKSVWK